MGKELQSQRHNVSTIANVLIKKLDQLEKVVEVMEEASKREQEVNLKPLQELYDNEYGYIKRLFTDEKKNIEKYIKEIKSLISERETAEENYSSNLKKILNQQKADIEKINLENSKRFSNWHLYIFFAVIIAIQIFMKKGGF